MALRRGHLLPLSFLLFSHSFAAQGTNSSLNYDVFQYVDSLIGTANGGKVVLASSLSEWGAMHFVRSFDMSI